MNSTVTDIREDEEHLDYQKYTNYIDPSIMTIEHYRHKGIFEGSLKYVNKIEQWLAQSTDSEQNKPLVFQTESGIGKKAMLVQWLDHHNKLWASKRERHLVLLHFASIGGNNTNYFYAIYRLLIRLREALKIKQKVELLEEKIRKYFAYWLDVCNSELQKQLVVNDTVDVYDKIIIVIEGLQNFKDAETGKESNIAFWLPRSFPKNIKVIVTAEKSSEALKHLEKIGSEIVVLEPSNDIQNFILEKAISNGSIHSAIVRQKLFSILDELLQKESCRQNVYIFIETFVSGLIIDPVNKDEETIRILSNAIQTKLNFNDLKNLNSLDTLYEFLLAFWEDSGIMAVKSKFKQVLLMLLITQKGLTFEELALLTGVKEKEWKCITALFGVVIMSYKDLWMIHEACFKNIIFKKFGITDDRIRECHEKMADALNSTPNSIRKLEEQTYHLYVSKSYFKLKENISNIENFLLLFNPNNKYDLSRYWQKLEEKGFDPVIEYNKAIEGFSMHYHPTEENIFRIIVQISRFLKEFCDFETYYTPTFRHPPIQGSKLEMLRIGLLTELQKLSIYVDNSCGASDDEPVTLPSLKQQIDEIKQAYFTKVRALKPKQDNGKNNTFLTAAQTNSNSKSQETSSSQFASRQTASNGISRSPQQSQNSIHNILSETEQLNVDVPKNRQKFRKYYTDLLKDLTQKKENQGLDQQLDEFLEKDQLHNDIDDDEADYQPQSEEPLALNNVNSSSASGNNNNMTHSSGGTRSRDTVVLFSKKQKSSEIKLSKIRENYNASEVKPTLYYYKRWIWIQFPWACISLANNYSQTPELCLTSATEYMSVDTEAKFTRQALKIAIEAKERKKLMFTKKENQFGNTEESRINYENGSASCGNFMKISSKPGLFTILRQNNGSASNTMVMAGFQASGSMSSNTRDLASPLKRIPSSSNMATNTNASVTHDSVKPKSATIGTIETSLSALTKQLQAKKARVKLTEPLAIEAETESRRGKTSKKSRFNHEQSIMAEAQKEEEVWSVQFMQKLKSFTPQNNYNSMAKNEVLPKLKNEIKEHTEYELTFIKSHIERKKKLINQIIYENTKLAKIYKELKIKEIQLNSGESKLGTGTFEQLQEKKEKLRYEFSKSILQKERLKIILKLCSENKTKNEQYLTSLNYLLQNLKKMIKWERADMRALQEELEELQSLNEKTEQAEKEKHRNQDLLNSQIKQSMADKGELEKQISRMGTIISKELSCQKSKFENDISGDRIKNEQKNKQLLIEKNTKLMEDQLDAMQNNYQRIATLLGITGFDFTSNPEFKRLIQEKERNEQLRFVLFDRRNKLEELQNAIAKIKMQQSHRKENMPSRKTSQVKNKENTQTSSHNNLNINGVHYSQVTPEHIKQYKTLNEARLRMKIGFDNIALRMGLKEKTDLRETLLIDVNSRLQKLKEISEEKYRGLMENKLEERDLFIQEQRMTIVDEEDYQS